MTIEQRAERVLVLFLFLFAGCDGEQQDAPSARQQGKEQPQKEQPLSPEDIATFEIAVAKATCEAVRAKAVMWEILNGRYPASLDEMKGPLTPGEPSDEVKDDPWGNAYVYEVKDGTVRVSSFGPDGKEGTADDIFAEPDR